MVRSTWLNGKREESYDMVSEKMTKTLGIAGEPEECPRRLKEYRRAGVDTPILYPTAVVSKRRGGRSVAGTVKEACILAIKAAS